MTFEEEFPELADPNGDVELECKMNPIAAMLLNCYLERRENTIYKSDIKQALLEVKELDDYPTPDYIYSMLRKRLKL